MTMLDRASTGIKRLPPLLLGYGVDGVGKTTFASEAPNPIFLGPEKGSENLNVTRFPNLANWNDAIECLEDLNNTSHEHKTLVVDTLDWMENLLHAHICAEHNAKTIEGVDGGYGRGHSQGVTEWLKMQGLLTTLRENKGMTIILLAHSQVSEFDDPSTEKNYNRYELKLYKSQSGNTDYRALWREFVDAVIFINFESFSVGKGKAVKGISSGERKMYTVRNAAFDAKNRYSMDTELPFVLGESWATISNQIDRFFGEDPVQKEQVQEAEEGLLQRVAKMALEVKDEELQAQVKQSIEQNMEDNETLKIIEEKLTIVLDGQ